MRDYLERALRILEAHYGPDHPAVAQTLTDLGMAYEDLGDASKQRMIQEVHYWPKRAVVVAATTRMAVLVIIFSIVLYAKQRGPLEGELQVKEVHIGYCDAHPV
eukprot:5929395-Amphidinium_carterae.1